MIGLAGTNQSPPKVVVQPEVLKVSKINIVGQPEHGKFCYAGAARLYIVASFFFLNKLRKKF